MKLEDLLEREKELGIRGDTPALVTRCIDYLLPAHVKEEGLFRLSGAATDIQKMRDAIDKGALHLLGKTDAVSPFARERFLTVFVRPLRFCLFR